MFSLYPDLKGTYRLSQNLRVIFSKKSDKDSARLNPARGHNRVTESSFNAFNIIADTFYEHSDEIINFFECIRGINQLQNQSIQS